MWDKTIVKRIFTLHGQQRKISLEQLYWESFDEICKKEKITESELLELIMERINPRSSLTGGIKLFLTIYNIEQGYKTQYSPPSIVLGEPSSGRRRTKTRRVKKALESLVKNKEDENKKGE